MLLGEILLHNTEDFINSFSNWDQKKIVGI